MVIKFKGDMTKVVAKNKGDMTKTTLRKRVSTIISQILGGGGGGGGSLTSLPDLYTKLLLHFDDNIASSTIISSIAAPWSGILSKDGTKVYVGANQTAGLYVINAATNSLIKTITSPGQNFHLVMNSDGSKIYGANNGTGGVNVFDASSDTLLSTIATSMAYARSLAITPNDKFLFVGDEAGGLYRIDLTVTTPSATLLGNLTWGVYGLVISPDGTKLLTSTGSNVKVYTLDQVTGAITLSSTLTGFSAYFAVGSATSAYYTDATNNGITPVLFSTSTKGSTITTGAGPCNPMVSPDGKKLYVSNTTANTMSIIDITTNVVVDTLTGFTAPRGGAVGATKLFVANNTANTISVKDFNEGGTIASVFAPMRGVASPDGTKVYMGTWGSTSTGNGVHVIDVATNTKTTTVSTPGTTLGFTINSTGTRVYAAQYGTTSSNNSGTNVYVINATNNTLVATVPVGTGAHSLAITPDDKFVYVACDTSGGLYRIDTATNTATSMSIATGLWATVISPDGTKLLFSNGSNVYVYSINTTTGALTYVSTLTGFNGAYTSTKNANYAYFLNNGASSVTPVSWATLTAETAITVGGGPYGGSVSSDGKKLFVSNNSGNSVSVIDTASNKVIDTITGYSSPRGAVFAGNKLFVANNGAGNVPVVDMRTFSDSALSPMSQNRAGTSVLTSTTQSKFGGKSLLLNGTNTNKLQFANPKGKAINFGSSNWTIEGWFWFNQKNIGYQPMMCFTDFHATNDPLPQLMVHATTNCLYFEVRNDSSTGTKVILSTSTNPDANRWYHIAVVRNGGTITMYVDGTSVGSVAISGIVHAPNYLVLGEFGHGTASSVTHFNGYMDGIRIQVGEAVYTGNFTAPTSAPTANSYTKLLMNFDSTIKDESTSPLYSYAVGTTAVVSSAQSKFGGSSLKMSGGTTDYVKIHNESQPVALLDRPFTIEGWFWLNANNTGYQPIIMSRTAGNYDGPVIYMEQDNTLYAQMSNAGGYWDYPISTGFTPSANAWHHVALVREYKSGPIKLYCDGVLRGSNATTASVFTGENIYIGHYPNFGASQQTLNGYIDEVRITLDYCAYNGNFTPAAAPFTDGKNLLMHFDGANNSTTMTDSSTYGRSATASGGAVISTSQSKFGGSSLYLPGNSTNAVVIANSPDFAFGAENFTVEAWINVAGMSAGLSGTYYNAIFDTRITSYDGNTNNGLFFCLNSSRKLIAFNNGSIFYTGNTSLNLNSWYHIAAVRKGNKFYVYINGSLDGSVDVSFNLTQSGMRIGSNFDAASVGGIGFNGYIDEFRATKGTALYAPSIGDTTAPTAQLSASANTKLMLNFNSDSNDSSANPATVTAYGGAVLSSDQSKFGGKSMKFTRSTGSRLTVSNVGNKLQFGSSDFCIETWLYLNSMPGGSTYPSGYWIMGYGADMSGAGFDYWIGTTNIICAPVDYGIQPINVAHGMTTNRWYHVALSRNGGTLNLFIDGFLKGSASISGAIYTIPSTGANANMIAIGSGEPGAGTAGNFDGYMDDFRITIGEPVYLPNPSTPFTLIG